MKATTNSIFLFFIFLSFNTFSQSSEISEFSITNDEGRTVFVVNKSGEISFNEQPMGIINSNGQLKNTEGQVIASINDNGMLLNKENQPIGKIDNKGTIDNGSGLKLSWSAANEFMSGDKKLGIRVLTEDVKSMKLASIVLYLFMM